MSNENEVKPSDGERCPDCGGDGFAYYTRGNTRGGKCRYCDGTGRDPTAPADGEREEPGPGVADVLEMHERFTQPQLSARIAILEAQLAAARVAWEWEDSVALSRALSSVPTTTEAEYLRSQCQRLDAELAAARAENERLKAELVAAQDSAAEMIDQRRVALDKLSALTAEAERLRGVLNECLTCDGNIDNPGLEDRIRSALAASAVGQGKAGT